MAEQEQDWRERYADFLTIATWSLGPLPFLGALVVVAIAVLGRDIPWPSIGVPGLFPWLPCLPVCGAFTHLIAPIIWLYGVLLEPVFRRRAECWLLLGYGVCLVAPLFAETLFRHDPLEERLPVSARLAALGWVTAAAALASWVPILWYARRRRRRRRRLGSRSIAVH